MCRECGQFICPGSCPNYNDFNIEGDEAVAYCECCGVPLKVIDEFMTSECKHYCPECVSQFNLDDVLRVCGIFDIFELLAELGCKFEKI